MKKAVVIRALTIALILTYILGFIGHKKANEIQNEREYESLNSENEAVAVKGDYPAAIMVDGVVYYLAYAMPAEIDESAIVGYTTSYTNEMPQSNGETNFNRELNMAYAKVSDGIAILYENEWWLCKP